MLVKQKRNINTHTHTKNSPIYLSKYTYIWRYICIESTGIKSPFYEYKQIIKVVGRQTDGWTNDCIDTFI